ncbi:MAG: carbohydrate porin, partial [Spirulinaceae cyanobacterium RM2_2_10]|nr:carbohydrate porin [Spirulinaceae cyanobacterium RM2_2_10]
LGLTYVHGYHSTGSPIFGEGESRVGGQRGLVGSYSANNPWVLLTDNASSPTVTNSYGAEAAFNLSESITVSGFISWTDARLLERGDADIWTYGLGLAVPDFGKEGSVLGLFGGIQPTLRGINASGLERDRGRTDDVWHVEGFYKYQLTDNITITPGVVWVMSPNQDARDSSNVIGTLRTTFSF